MKDALTDREAEVAALLHNSDKVIARATGRTVYSVKTAVRRVLVKLHVENRTQAVIKLGVVK